MEVDVPPSQTSQTTPFDLPKISAFLELPLVTIESLAGISETFIATVLDALTTKARFHDELKADKIRLEVELEQRTRTANARVNSMKNRMETAQAETQDLRKQVAEAGLHPSPHCTKIYQHIKQLLTLSCLSHRVKASFARSRS